ncbi:MAG: NrfD/PsrC family molybdoenzyme membrane anchor subunit [Acidilobaceae archaeon]
MAWLRVQVAKFTRLELTIMAILLILALLGLVAWGYQLSQGLIVTNMRNIFPWGLYIATFAFLVGTAAGGLIVASSVYLLNIRELKPLAPLASLTALVFVLAAMAMVIPDLGRPERIYYIILSPNFTSLLVWDFIVLVSYAVLSLIHVYIGFKPYAAKMRGLPEHEVKVIEERSYRLGRLLSPISLPFAVLIHTVTAWIFAVNAGRPWWYGGFLAPSFIAAALVSGSAIVLLTSLLIYGFRDELKQAYNTMAKILGMAILIMLFLIYQDYVVRLWWGAEEHQILSILFLGRLWVTTIIGELIIILVAFILVVFVRTKAGLTLASILALIGVYAHRFNLMEPAYNVLIHKVSGVVGGVKVEEIVPVVLGDMKHTYWLVTYWPYFPSIIEITITLGWLSGAALVLYTLAKILFGGKS